MAGRVCVHGLFLRHYHHSAKSVNETKLASKMEEEDWHEGARLGGLAGERRVKRIRRPASRRVGARQFLGWQPCVGCTFVSPLLE